MTRKDFVLIAGSLLKAKPLGYGRDAYDQWAATVETLANTLASTNPLFDRARFLTAAGL